MNHAAPRTALISGASIAGPALAFWLHRYGFDVTVVERSAAVRGGGYNIDIRGAAVDVVKRMGIYDELKAVRTPPQTITFVDKDGREIASINTVDYVSQVNPEDLEIARGEVTTVLYAHTRDDVEYVFNDSIATLDTHDSGVDVTFTRGAPRTFDIVVGADGIHSNTRRLVFGEESRFSRYLGYTVAIFTVDGFRAEPQRSTMYNVPGLTAAFGRTTPGGPGQAFLAFRQDDPDALRETDFDGQCDLVARAYRNEGWRIPEIVTAMRSTDDLYFDSVGQIRMDEWSKDRVALVGDSCFAPAFLSGQGTSMALIGSYCLATALANNADHTAAFAEYDRACRAFMVKSQDLALSGSLTVLPATEEALLRRNEVLRGLSSRRPGGGDLGAATREASNAITLPEVADAADRASG
ncbi:FAD-dependent monooxygenase [Streptomyces sp. NBC_01716]|uniref:FAD-dependent monooxygenase n=1 Tax=Streptomyces sp. NBC_01716 TaxID=2975917 RepID=UPI002E364668|nr:FAD-dependent monooxygenase [Streptomyces sp. NBC_01716]